MTKLRRSLRSLLSWKALRIVWSTVFATIALLLCALWVRSYWRGDDFTRIMPSAGASVLNHWGGVKFQYIAMYQNLTPSWQHIRFRPASKNPWERRFQWVVGNGSRFGWFMTVIVPHWFLVSIAGFLAVLPWVFRRFTVRRMLVLTTLLAVFFASVAMSL
jgi:hypothetical protein